MLPVDTDSLNALHSLDSRIKPYVKCLLTQQNSILGMTDVPLCITDAYSGYLPRETNGTNKSDRFKLKIPYAHQVLTWEVIFDSANLKEPPDFIFDEEDEDFCPSLEEINSLVCWTWKNSESLLAVLTDLLDLYKEYQLEKAGTNLVLQRHMRSLLAESPDSMQIIVNKTERGFGTVNVLVKLDGNISSLPPYLVQDIPGTDTAVLHVHFPSPESKYIQTKLLLSPRVDVALGGSHNLRIPPFHHGALLGEYVSNVKQLLTQQVKLVLEGFEKKKEYISAFLSHFGTAVLEYDAQSFSKIILLLEWNDFFFTFSVELPPYFPMEHPTYIFKSVYHLQNKKPYTEKRTNFPYSPRWSGNEMAQRASAYILNTIKDFQRTSVTYPDR